MEFHSVKFHFLLYVREFPECSADVDLPELPDFISCHLTEICTAVECCLEVGVLKTTATFYLAVDACEQKLEIGIEQIKLIQDFRTFEFGKEFLF